MFDKNRFLYIALVIAILIIFAFFLPWINWGLISVSGINVPKLYKTMTKITNIFSNQGSPYMAYATYLIPLLSVAAIAFAIKARLTVAKYCLLFASTFGALLSVYMYFFMITHKVLKLSNTGAGIHLLFVSTVAYIAYFIIARKKQRELAE